MLKHLFFQSSNLFPVHLPSWSIAAILGYFALVSCVHVKLFSLLQHNMALTKTGFWFYLKPTWFLFDNELPLSCKYEKGFFLSSVEREIWSTLLFNALTRHEERKLQSLHSKAGKLINKSSWKLKKKKKKAGSIYRRWVAKLKALGE